MSKLKQELELGKKNANKEHNPILNHVLNNIFSKTDIFNRTFFKQCQLPSEHRQS